MNDTLTVERFSQLTHAEKEALATGRGQLHSGRVIPVMRGAGLGTGAVYARNLPSPGSYVIDPVTFALKTSRNRKTNAPIAWNGYGSGHSQRVDAVGVAGRLLIKFTGTFTNTATAAIGTGQFPWNIIKSLVVSANGINNLFSCDGLDLRALQRIRNKYFIDRQSTFTIGANSAAWTYTVYFEVPLAFDDSLLGAVFAQTEETYINVAIQSGAAADLWTVPGNAPVVTNASFTIIPEFYSIPTTDSKAGRVLVLPDVRQLHGVVSQNTPLTISSGDHISNLIRTGGILCRTLQRIDNTDAGNSDPGTFVTSHKFRYGGNIVPLEMGGDLVKLQNQMDYGDKILQTADTSATAPAYLVDDFVNDNPLRDAVHMLGITEPQLINTLGNGFAATAGAVVHTVQESMVAG